MQFEIKITNEAGKTSIFNLTRSSFGEEKNLNDFILEALLISEDKRKLPFLIQCPNGVEVHPSIKMKFENNGSPLLGDELKAMVVTWY